MPLNDAFSAVHCSFKVIIFISRTNVSISKMHCNAEFKCVNSKCEPTFISVFLFCFVFQKTKISLVFLPDAGAYSWLRDGVRRRRRLLPRVQRHGVGGQRGERSPLDSASGSNYAPEHSRNEKSSRNSQRSRKYLGVDAGRLMLWITVLSMRR